MLEFLTLLDRIKTKCSHFTTPRSFQAQIATNPVLIRTFMRTVILLQMLKGTAQCYTI